MENQKLMMQRHSLAHILANAVQNLYGKDNVKLTIGPAISDGFYYDFDITNSLTASDLPKIENEMQSIIKKGEPFVEKTLTKAEALKLFSDNPYKIELINEIPENEENCSLLSWGRFF